MARASYLLREAGNYLLREDGFKIILVLADVSPDVPRDFNRLKFPYTSRDSTIRLDNSPFRVKRSMYR